MEILLERPFLSLTYTEVDDTMTRDSNSQTPEEEGADDGRSPPSQQVRPGTASGNNKVRRPSSQSELFPGLDRESIRRVIYRIVQDLHTMEEIEQDVSIIWYDNRWRWRLIRRPQEYVQAIARHEALRHLRVENSKRQRFKAYVGSQQPLDAPLLRREAPDIAKIIAARSTFDAFKASLPAHLHPVLHLRLQGCKTREIAASLGISFDTVKSYLADIATYAGDVFVESDTAPSPQDPGKER